MHMQWWSHRQDGWLCGSKWSYGTGGWVGGRIEQMQGSGDGWLGPETSHLLAHKLLVDPCDKTTNTRNTYNEHDSKTRIILSWEIHLEIKKINFNQFQWGNFFCWLIIFFWAGKVIQNSTKKARVDFSFVHCPWKALPSKLPNKIDLWIGHLLFVIYPIQIENYSIAMC